MRLWIRRIIFSLFALAFVVSAIGVLLYSNGYRFNLGSGWFEKTGVVTIDSVPTNAIISLGTATTGSFWQRSISQVKPYKTPARVTYVLPGKYHVVLSKDGFWDFARDIDVKAGVTSFFTNGVLLKKDALRHVVDVSSVRSMYLLGKTRYLIQTPNDLFIVERKTQTAEKIYHSQEEITELLIAPSGNFGVFKTGTLWLRLNLFGVDRTITIIDVPENESLVFGDRDMLYGCGPDGISSYPNASRVVVKNKTPILDCEIVENILYTMSIEGSEVVVRALPLNQLKGSEEMVARFLAQKASFSKTLFPYMIIHTDKGQTYIYNIQNRQHLLDIDSMTTVTKADQKTLIANNAVEINRYSISGSDSSKELMTREGGAISHVFAIESVPYVFFVRENRELVALEQTTFNPNRYTLVMMDAINDVRVSSDEKTLLIAGRREGVEAIFELNVLE